MSTIPKLRCAIYTRKSTEEGLDQAFNSLDAQREACEAFIISQASLGWMVLPDLYDDGGISGGTMERPALQRLLRDIRDKKIDVVVVYKIDRLTRSLTDFSRIVEIFDGHGVSFVSITQQFNTTTSMGRLTLNVLLSFAQFEREVTAERIRDKFAASKRKGMWMGGSVPLGYQVLERKLIVDVQEAETVRWLFRRYRNLRSIKDLSLQAREANLYRRENRRFSDKPFSRGQLTHLLSNPVYLGKMRHKDALYEGEHDAIVDADLFDEVQSILKELRPRRRATTNGEGLHLLKDILCNGDGKAFLLAQSQAHGKRYQYYLSRRDDCDSRDQSATAVEHSSQWRLSAGVIEPIVERQLHNILADKTTLADWLKNKNFSAFDLQKLLDAAACLSGRYRLIDSKVEKQKIIADIFERIWLKRDAITFDIRVDRLQDILANDIAIRLAKESNDQQNIVSIRLPIRLKQRGMENRIVLENADHQPECKDGMLINMIAKAHLFLGALTDGKSAGRTDIAQRLGIDPADISRILPLAFLSPKITEAIFSGRQPVSLTTSRLTRVLDLPMRWSDQEALLLN